MEERGKLSAAFKIKANLTIFKSTSNFSEWQQYQFIYNEYK